MIPTEHKYQDRGRDLLADAANTYGFTLLDGYGNPLNAGTHRLVDGHAHAQAANGTGTSELGWDNVSGRVMRYKDYTGYGGYFAEAANRWNSTGIGAKILPTYGNNQDVSVSMRTGDGWIGLATSSGQLYFDPGFVGSSGSNGILSLMGHELGHHLGLDHMGGTLMNSSVSSSGGNAEYPTASDISRASYTHGTAPGKPRVPALADGGIVTSKILAMLGEDGEEAVIPLNSPRATSKIRTTGNAIEGSKKNDDISMAGAAIRTAEQEKAARDSDNAQHIVDSVEKLRDELISTLKEELQEIEIGDDSLRTMYDAGYQTALATIKSKTGIDIIEDGLGRKYEFHNGMSGV